MTPAPVRIAPARPAPPEAGRPFEFLDGRPGRLGAALLPLAAHPDALPGRLLVEPGGLEALLAPLRRTRLGVALRPLTSFWSRYLFLAVIPPAVLTALLAPRHLPWRVAETGVVLNEAGLPVAVGLRDAGRPAAGPAPLEERLAPFLHGYLEPVVEGLAAGARLAPRILWGNVAHYLDWVARSLGDEVSPALAKDLTALLQGPDWPSGGRNPVRGLIRRMPGQDGPQRAVCCLLRQMPEGKTCRGCPGASCPRLATKLLAETDNLSHKDVTLGGMSAGAA
ncbi:siderophore-iron reductase FhuF [Muricoccus radiodurans]|uniref:siderophore-iron reductase FhuF n=1 Tax=Muricoccus radiodurans TaxID=2231721 RepID=UPI003CE6E2D0